MTNLEKLSEKQLSVRIENSLLDINKAKDSLLNTKSTAFGFLIVNLLLITIIGVVVLSRVVEGFTYSHWAVFSLVIAFIFFNALSIFLLFISIFKVNKAQQNEIFRTNEVKGRETTSHEALDEYYTRVIEDLDQAKEDMKMSLKGIMNLNNTSMIITAAIVIIYSTLISFLYFF